MLHHNHEDLVHPPYPTRSIGCSRCDFRSLFRAVLFVMIYHPFRLWDGELGLEPPVRCFRATSAASSLALFTFWPSYQKRAEMACPCTVTVLDQAVRPPIVPSVNWPSMSRLWRMGGLPLLSDMIWNTGGWICTSRHFSFDGQS